MKSLSPRLQRIVEMLEPCRAVADIGTDHAYVALASVSSGVADHAWAVDLREAPLEQAALHVRQSGLEEKVTLLCGDGLLALGERDADAVVIAGMSGESMVAIFEASRARFSRAFEGTGRRAVRQIVVQPNQNVHLVRAWAFEAGWHLVDERIESTPERAFFFCRFQPGAGADPAYRLEGFSLTDLFHLGPLLLKRKDPKARRYFEEQRARLSRWSQEAPQAHEQALARWTLGCEFCSRP